MMELIAVLIAKYSWQTEQITSAVIIKNDIADTISCSESP